MKASLPEALHGLPSVLVPTGGGSRYQIIPEAYTVCEALRKKKGCGEVGDPIEHMNVQRHLQM